MLVPLDILKKHLRVLHGHQDTLIAIYAASAERRISSHIGRRIYAKEADIPPPGHADHDPHAITTVPEIVAAVLILTELSWLGKDGEGVDSGHIGLPVRVAGILAGLRVWRTPADEGCRRAAP